ncbi:hypothetical protein [Arthrobacter sp. GMC3]|uniref:hypothetical protein n=1 Tax=Arthrobacter sp. GMC3 TaxID=2058894 RepID=UPI000CE4CC75|nr:hypothetical protein [Arthrobacter sp. GMC3]
MPVQDEDLGIAIFIAVGILVVVLIIVFGVISTRRKNRAITPSYDLRIVQAAGQPALATSSVDRLNGKRQWELFQQLFAPGTEVPMVPVSETASMHTPADGNLETEPLTRTLRVSRLSREVREGWPNAMVGFTAYFEPYEFIEFPAVFDATARKFQLIKLSQEGIQILTADQSLVWEASWDSCKVAGVNKEIKLHNGKALMVVDRESINDDSIFEALCVKYGTYWPSAAA